MDKTHFTYIFTAPQNIEKKRVRLRQYDAGTNKFIVKITAYHYTGEVYSLELE